MYQGHRYIDSDAHILEPSNLWERYLDPEFREEMPSHALGYRGDAINALLRRMTRGDA